MVSNGVGGGGARGPRKWSAQEQTPPDEGELSRAGGERCPEGKEAQRAEMFFLLLLSSSFFPETPAC